MSEIPRRRLVGDLEVSVIGFGASPLGSVFREVSQAEANAAVAAALEEGINYFDTSPFYGVTKSELALGEALRKAAAPRDSYVVSTKAGRYGEKDFDFSPERVARSIDESLERLGCGHIDLLILHDVEFCPPGQDWRDAVPALVAAKAAGKIRHFGVSAYPRDAFARLPPELDVALTYCHHNLCTRTAAPLVGALRGAGLGVVNASPLAMGLLSTRRPLPAWHPAPARLVAACDAAAAAVLPLDISDVAVRWAVANALPGVATTLVGVSSPAEARAAANAARLATAGGEDAAYDEAVAKAERELKGTFDVTWEVTA